MYQILTPIKVGPITVKNRIAYLGMAKQLADPGGFVSERQIAYYTNFAKNGVGMITTGGAIIDPDYPSQLPHQHGLYDDKFIPGMKKLADSVHQYGAKIFMQLWHAGLAAYGCTREQVKAPEEWTVDEIHNLQRLYVEAIVRCQKAGVDGVEWHMAHNYLPEQFAVPAFNKRTDEYGADTIENAARFSVEAIKKARELVGDYPITAKINAWDMGIEGGMTPDWCAQLCVELEKAGVDLITVSAGGGLSDIRGMSGDGTKTEGWKIPYAETVKKAVSIPVMASGSIRHVIVMEEALRTGKCDMIGMGRGLKAEPEFVKKVMEGREDELRYCLNCYSCSVPNAPSHKHCSLNPTCTREIEDKPLVIDGDGRKVVIVGAGPAGVSAAITLAKRGFKPEIFEKSGFIGGSIRYATAPYAKWRLNWAVDYYHRMINKLGIKVHLSTEVNAADIKAMDAYAVILATGSTPIRPASIPGIFGKNVYMAKEILEAVPAYTDETVVAIGGGMVGLEIASTFAHQGCKATVVEMQPFMQILSAGAPNVIASMHAKETSCVLKYEHKVIEIKEDGVLVEAADGKQELIPATKVVICMGFKSDTALYDELSKELPRVYKIGDADFVDNIAYANRTGYVVARDL